MLLKGIVDEDFVNYRVPSMFISTNTCTFKCDKENGTPVCQNSALAKQESIDISIDNLIARYLKNDITKAIVFGGLEPIDQLVDVYDFIFKLRADYHCEDPVVIYTGYTKEEIKNKISILCLFNNIIMKYGRFRPGDKPHYDPILGINLASNNQYAEVISNGKQIEYMGTN